MKLKQLLAGIEVKEVRGSKEVEITGICSDSRLVVPGNLFIAKKGQNFDASLFIPQAVLDGAAAVLTDFYDPFLGKTVQIIHEHPREIEAQIAARYYRYPAKELFTVGITGTNGKTTTAYLIRHFLGECGMIGTNEYIVGQNRMAAKRTTPECVLLQKYLREMAQSQQKSVVMEVTSHALAQNRVAFVDFKAAIFTNLSQDHLDYHGDMENYFLSKRKLFTSLSKESVAIINNDSDRADNIKAHTVARIFTYGIDCPSDLRAQNICLTDSGTFFEVVYKDEVFKASSPLIGRFNVYNLLAASSAALAYGLKMEDILQKAGAFNGAAGRLEKIENVRGIALFVDFAHTPGALENVLLTLKEINKGRIILVFGCGGNRDRGKRKLMGGIAEKYADLSVLTADNSRSEPPESIIAEIAQGFSDRGKYLVSICRKTAIEMAISRATEGDIVLIAGKGHETNMEFSGRTELFDDRKVAREVLSYV